MNLYKNIAEQFVKNTIKFGNYRKFIPLKYIDGPSELY